MQARTRELWQTQQQLVGDRRPLFAAVADAVEVHDVLYPGSYVDLTPSFIWPSVTYVDVDRRAAQFFADVDGLDELLEAHGAAPDLHEVRFLQADYEEPLALDIGSFDLLISLYAGFVSEHCTRYLRRGGYLFVNSSHGDAAMASIEPDYRLSAVVTHRSGRYRLSSADIDSYLVPKRDIVVTKELLHDTGRGVAYTKSPFAYLFRRVA